MKLLADWMLDANRQGMMRSFPSRHFDFDELARSLGPLARFDFPRIHVAGATFHVHTQPGGIDVRLQPSTPA